ncbi:MAG: YciI family protein [Pseudomonadota bacterium]|jgi:hypothetical protein|nr:YciI family protein [Pseudomonadota bacterium]
MKTYLIICKDKKNSLSKRLANRNLHLNHLKSLKKKLILAGPILNKNQKPKGSVLIIKFQNRTKLREFLKKDPYSKVKLFESVVIEEFKRVF